MDPQTELLLRKSAQDESALSDTLPETIFGFLAQQPIEKLLKALLAQMGLQYPLTHDLTRLKTDLAAVGETLPPAPVALSELNEYAVNYRYDDPLAPTPLNRQEVAATVHILREFVHRRVAEIDRASGGAIP